ncbi:hypothetical protein DL93DRAFT_2091890 [Clavulina sp. PMI_390]|nr:hypothetical protein DL93DRAFT_2091890 [Clavulina sp. PMI_390]
MAILYWVTILSLLSILLLSRVLSHIPSYPSALNLSELSALNGWAFLRKVSELQLSARVSVYTCRPAF